MSHQADCIYPRGPTFHTAHRFLKPGSQTDTHIAYLVLQPHTHLHANCSLPWLTAMAVAHGAEIIMKPEHFPKTNPFRQRTPSDYHSAIPPDLLALNRLTPTTKTDIPNFMASLMFSRVFVGPPHGKHTNHHHLSRSPSFKCQTITLTELWIISCHLRCSLN